MFREELRVVATSTCEQHKVQHLKKTRKQGTSSTYFLHLKVFLHFQFGFRFMRPLLCLFQNSLAFELCFDSDFDVFVGAIIVGAIVA
jgi:hypothetical protein